MSSLQQRQTITFISREKTNRREKKKSHTHTHNAVNFLISMN